jgi:hypothetical protein
VLGGVRLCDGTQLSVVTGIDDHSRYCEIAKLVARATANLCDALIEGLSRHGAPEEILTLNGRGVHRKAGLRTIPEMDSLLRPVPPYSFGYAPYCVLQTVLMAMLR